MIYAATGHRPEKLGGYSQQVQDRLIDLATEFIQEYKPTLFISGMALGWDQAVADACYSNDVPFIAAIPFPGQDSRWRPENRRYYRALLQVAKEVVVVSPGEYKSWKMHARNHWMVHKCDKLVALWDGNPEGGTAKCIEYAVKHEKPYINLWEKWNHGPRHAA